MKIESAICLIQDINSGLFLLLKRTKAMRQYSNLFSLPGGRFDEELDTSILDTLRREVKEETNIDISFDNTTYLMGADNGDWNIQCFHSLVDMDEVDLKLNPDEHSEFVFVSREDIMFYLKDVPITIDCVNKYINEVFPSY